MADLVGLQAQVPDVLGKLGQLLTLKNARAQAQMAEQDAQQRKNIAAYDWSKHTGPDGVIDLASFDQDQEAPIIFGDKYIDYRQHVAAANQQGLAAKQTLMGLRSEQRNALASMVGSLRSDPDVAKDTPEGRQKVNEAFIQYQQLYGTENTLPVLKAYGPLLQNTPKGKMADSLKTIQLSAFDADKQLQMQQPQYTSKGGALTNINPVAANSPQDIPLTLPPGYQIVTDANGRQFAVNPQNNTVTPVGTGKQSNPAPSASPSAPTFTQPVPQQKELEEHVSDVRKSDSDYGLNQHVNDELLRLSADTSTGPGTSIWHTGTIGKIIGTTGGNAAADYQKIGAYLDRQAALSAKQMGLPDTNAGLATAASLSGTTEYTPAALQTKVKLTSALVEGAHQYRKGLDKVIGTGPNQDLSKLQEFRAQWADNFDPMVFRVENALRRDDKKELSEIRDEIGSEGMAQLKEKSANLRKLENGELLK